MQLLDIEGLQVASHVQHRVTVFRPQGLDLAPQAEMIIHAIHLTRPRRAAVVKNELPQRAPQLWIEPSQRFVERALSHAGWAG